MIRSSFFIFCILFSATLKAQKTYTLQQCIDSAIAQNITIKRVQLTSEAARVDWNQSKMNQLPNLNARVDHNRNAGRSIDPFTNTYVNQSVNAANYGVGSGLVIFRGRSLQNTIRQTATAYDASVMEWRQSKNDLILDVIAAYLQVLTSEDQVDAFLSQIGISQASYERLQIMNQQGAVRPSDASDLKGQLMNDQLSLLNARTELETSKLQLLQLMNQPYDSTIRVEKINTAEFLSPYPNSADEVYLKSLAEFPLIKAVELRTRSAEFGVKASKGLLYPTIELNAGINTNYSSIAQNQGQKISYTNQLRNNRFSQIGIGVDIPIFNNSIARNRVKLADINLRDVELRAESIRLQIRQEVDAAYLNMTNAYERYKLLLQQVSAYEESYRAAEVRFLSGVGTSIDYLTAKDRLDRANINLVNAKYLFVLRKKVLDYYNVNQ